MSERISTAGPVFFIVVLAAVLWGEPKEVLFRQTCSKWMRRDKEQSVQ